MNNVKWKIADPDSPDYNRPEKREKSPGRDFCFLPNFPGE